MGGAGIKHRSIECMFRQIRNVDPRVDRAKEAKPEAQEEHALTDVAWAASSAAVRRGYTTWWDIRTF